MPFENLLNISVKKDWIDCLSALLTPIVALFGICIAYRQWRTEETRLRHELFERRYRQFKAVGNFVRSIIIRNEMARDNEITFLTEIAEMRFIFDEKTASYVNENIWKIACEIDTLRDCYKENHPHEERKRNLEQQLEKRDNLRKSLDVFEKESLPYMQLQQTSIETDFWRYMKTLFDKIKNAAD